MTAENGIMFDGDPNILSHGNPDFVTRLRSALEVEVQSPFVSLIVYDRGMRTLPPEFDPYSDVFILDATADAFQGEETLANFIPKRSYHRMPDGHMYEVHYLGGDIPEIQQVQKRMGFDETRITEIPNHGWWRRKDTATPKEMDDHPSGPYYGMRRYETVLIESPL